MDANASMRDLLRSSKPKYATVEPNSVLCHPPLTPPHQPRTVDAAMVKALAGSTLELGGNTASGKSWLMDSLSEFLAANYEVRAL